MKYELSPQERSTYFKYASLALPRHTSYPIAPIWKDDYTWENQKNQLTKINASQDDISLYFHIPYCQQLCFYCACNKEIHAKNSPQHDELIKNLIAGLKQEIKFNGTLLKDSEVKQIHFGGGTPTYLPRQVFKDLFQYIDANFSIADDAEIAIEIDPRTTDLSYLELLFSLGFNRLSLGVQEFNSNVQKAINRIQPFELVQKLVNDAREVGFGSINFDLIYGLPYQTLETMRETLDLVEKISPDRIAFYRLAVIPEIFKWQKAFTRTDMPSSETVLALNLMAINHFKECGYDFIGLDHFAKKEEHLGQAYRDKTLRRTFQGMTTGGSLDVIGMGPSAISIMDHAFAQNEKDRKKWEGHTNTPLPIVKGLELSDDDKLRRDLLQDLYGYGEIAKKDFEKKFKIDFNSYFASELKRLIKLEQEGVVELTEDKITLTIPLGHLLMRVVASVFDKYLPEDAYSKGISPTAASKLG